MGIQARYKRADRMSDVTYVHGHSRWAATRDNLDVCKRVFVTTGVLTGVKALDDGRSVDEVATAQDTHQMLIDFSQMQPARPLHSLACNTATITVSCHCK
jgi:hypothetical protein